MPWQLHWFGQRRLLPLLIWCVAAFLYTARGFALEVPPLEGRINDHAQILSADTRQRLTNKLAAYEQATGHQLAVLTVPSLGSDPIEDFGIRVVEAWKLGKKGQDDGILLLVASGDKKMRIEVGYGLEGTLPDAAAGRIVRDVMAPHFRRGDYDAGISAAVDAILASTGAESLVDGDAQTDPNKQIAPKKAAPVGALGWIGWILATLFKLAFFGIFVVVFIILAVINMLGGGRRSRGMYIGGGGFGGGGGGGGGSFGGGGGSFGGGGASGDW